MKKQITAIDDNATKNFQAAFQMGVTVPLKVLVSLWNKDESSLTKMARDGKIPGAYKKGSAWWVWPKLLTEPSEDFAPVKPRTVFSNYSKPIQPRRNRR